MAVVWEFGSGSGVLASLLSHQSPLSGAGQALPASLGLPLRPRRRQPGLEFPARLRWAAGPLGLSRRSLELSWTPDCSSIEADVLSSQIRSRGS